MRRMQFALLTAAYAFCVGVLNYEVLSHAWDLFGFPLPGTWEAQRVDREVRYHPLTDLPPLDRILHEGVEAAVFYEDLLR